MDYYSIQVRNADEENFQEIAVMHHVDESFLDELCQFIGEERDVFVKWEILRQARGGGE